MSTFAMILIHVIDAKILVIIKTIIYDYVKSVSSVSSAHVTGFNTEFDHMLQDLIPSK
jgi:hypothetical protein